jgi:hypothetical protein
MIKKFKVLCDGVVKATTKTIKKARKIRGKLMNDGYDNIIIRVEEEDV